MAEKARRITVILFLLAIFALAAIYVLLWGVDIWKTQHEFAQTESDAAIRCVSQTFNVPVPSIDIQDGLLTFDIENPYGEQFNAIIIRSGNQSERVLLKDFKVLNTQHIKTNINVERANNFTIAPEGCELKNKKSYALS